MFARPEQTCPHCGKDFLPSADRQKYCSKLCKQRAQNKRFYQRHQEAERQRLNESNKRRRSKQQRRASIARSVQPLKRRPPTPADELEAAFQKIMERLKLTRGQAIARAIRELAASID